MKNSPKKILVGLSGGVDSSVAALLLKEQGHDVSGAYLRTWVSEEDVWGDCPAAQDIKDAEATSKRIGIPFEVVTLIDEYSSKVVDYMVKGYSSGETPNPDVVCNREIKFGAFLEFAIEQGFDGVGTGHYCRRVVDGSKTQLWEGADKNKDQSYFLALVKEGALSRAEFPLGNLTKPQVRELAASHGLPTAKKKDSQGICFLGKVKVNDFLREYISDSPGDIIKPCGQVVGRHLGLHRYTLGQRKGIGVPSNSDDDHYVVVAKQPDQNKLVVAFDGPDAPGLYNQRFLIGGLSFLGEPIEEERSILAKPRYRDASQQITYLPRSKTLAEVIFEIPQRALAQGQMIAFYEGQRLLGGGIYQ